MLYLWKHFKNFKVLINPNECRNLNGSMQKQIRVVIAIKGKYFKFAFNFALDCVIKTMFGPKFI